LLKVDIEDFFHSISEGKVFYAFLELGYPPFFALELARICTAVSPVEFRPDKAKEEPAPEVKEVSFDDEFPFGNPVPVPEGARALASAPANRAQLWSAIDIYANVAEGFLPQGAPTSPMLSNLIMRPIDEKLKDLAKTYRFSYTRYADDLAFSSTQNLTLEKVKRLKAAVLSVLLTAGFKANKRKTVIRSPGARRIVLGILVDGDVPRLAKEYNAALRQHLFYLSSSSHGPSKHAEARNTSVSTLYHHIRGKIAWAERIEPKFGRACLEKFETVVWPPLDASR
jgi:RNA-directed DNA polymerase